MPSLEVSFLVGNVAGRQTSAQSQGLEPQSVGRDVLASELGAAGHGTAHVCGESLLYCVR